MKQDSACTRALNSYRTMWISGLELADLDQDQGQNPKTVPSTSCTTCTTCTTCSWTRRTATASLRENQQRLLLPSRQLQQHLSALLQPHPCGKRRIGPKRPVFGFIFWLRCIMLEDVERSPLSAKYVFKGVTCCNLCLVSSCSFFDLGKAGQLREQHPDRVPTICMPALDPNRPDTSSLGT